MARSRGQLVGACCVTVACLLAAAWSTRAAEAPGAAPAGTGQAKAAGDEADAPLLLPATRPAGEKGLDTMLLDRPQVPITAPSGKRRKKAPQALGLAPEGSRVVHRRCRFRKISGTGWYRVLFVSEAGRRPARPQIVLPNALLATIETLPQARREATFRISGESTLYRGRSFVLLSKATLDAAPGKKADVPTARSPLTALAAGASSKRAGTSSLAAALLARRTGPAVVASRTSTRPGADAESVAPTGGKPQVVSPSRMVVDRLVRILPEKQGGWVIATFVGDNTLQEAPMRLLPCRFLEDAERMAKAGGGLGIRFRVSGNVAEYKGKRYLLLRKLLYEYDMGQF